MGAACSATVVAWLDCRSHILHVLSHDAVNTFVPSYIGRGERITRTRGRGYLPSASSSPTRAPRGSAPPSLNSGHSPALPSTAPGRKRALGTCTPTLSTWSIVLTYIVIPRGGHQVVGVRGEGHFANGVIGRLRHFPVLHGLLSPASRERALSEHSTLLYSLNHAHANSRMRVLSIEARSRWDSDCEHINTVT